MAQQRHWQSSDFCINKTVLREGDVSLRTFPRLGAEVRVTVHQGWTIDGLPADQVRHNEAFSKLFENLLPDCDATIVFKVGYSHTEFDRNVEQAVQSMFVQEQSDMVILVKLVASSDGLSLLTDDLWVTLNCRLTLECVTDSLPIFEWSSDRKLDMACDLKECAGKLFQSHRLYDAFILYRTAFTLSSFVLDETSDPKNSTEQPLPTPSVTSTTELSLHHRAQKLRAQCACNIVACHFNWKNYDYVISLANEYITPETDNVKLLYRRGVARMMNQDYTDAMEDLKAAQLLDPQNKTICQQLAQAQNLNKQYLHRIGLAMKKMFS